VLIWYSTSLNSMIASLTLGLKSGLTLGFRNRLG